MITGTFPPRKFGGVTAVAHKISKYLVMNGHKVTVYTTDVGNDLHSRLDISNLESIDGIEVFHFKNISNSLAFKQRLYLPIGMAISLKKNIKNYDIIHIHDYRSFQNIIVQYYARKYKVPYILQAHGSVLPFFRKQRLKKLYDFIFGYRILKDASAIIALTKTEAEQYKQMGVEQNKIRIVPNGVDLSEYQNLPDIGTFRLRYGIKNDEKIVLYLARIHKIKGVDLLVDAFSDLTFIMKDVRLIIAGPDDGFLSELKMKINNLDIGNKIVFTGPLYQMKKLEAYIDADLYVLPSVYETFPNTVLEACACGTSVIVTKNCGISDIVEKVGLVVEYNKEQLRDAMFKMLNEDELRKMYGKEGMKIVYEELNWDKVIKKLEDVYLPLINQYY